MKLNLKRCRHQQRILDGESLQLDLSMLRAQYKKKNRKKIVNWGRLQNIFSPASQTFRCLEVVQFKITNLIQQNASCAAVFHVLNNVIMFL